ncbi:oligosaccharide flippase family protein [Sphingomonas olei]
MRILRKLPLLSSRSAAGAIWSLLDGVVAQALSLIVFIANTHFLPPSAFGALATSIVLIEMIRQLVFLPVASSINSQKSVRDSDYTVAFATNIAASVATGLILVAFSRHLDLVFPGAELSILVPFMVTSTVILGLSTVYEAILVRKLEFRSLAVRSIISIAIGGASGLYLAMNGYGIWSLVWQQLLQQGLSLVTIMILANWRPSLAFDRKDFIRIVRFAAHVSLNSLIGFIGYQADTMAVAYFLGPRSTGLFNSAKRIGTALNQVVLKPLERVALPTLVQFSGDPGKLRSAYLRALRITALGTAPVFLGVALISDDIVDLLLGTEWGGVAPVLSALAISFFGSTVMQYNSAVIMVSRQPKLQSIVNLAFVFVSLVLILVSVRYGIIGVAFAVVIRSFLILPVQTFLVSRIIKCSLRDVLLALVPAVSASTVMGVGIFLLSWKVSFSSLIIGMSVKIGLGFAIYAGTLLLIFRDEVFSLASGGSKLPLR